jgi:cyclopropane fatty-acyl-phospholipid synthase-like methyltransferase
MTTTEALYDAHATKWTRRERTMLSDFTARPFVLEELGPLAGTHVLDLGCGEGYVARLIAEAGAKSVFGVDVSGEMVRAARAATPPGLDCELRFEAVDASAPFEPSRELYDRIVAVFLFNYLDRAAMTAVLRLAHERLAPGGRFLFTVPHPCFPYMRDAAAPFYFDTEAKDYFAGVDHTYEGKIWRRDGTAVPVRCVHKTFADYFDALAAAGFSALPKLRELRVTAEHLALDPAFFGPLRGQPLHVLFRIDRP